MGRNKKTASLAIIIGSLVIASALIWGFVIIGTSNALKGTECYDEIQNYLFGGVSMHIILIGGIGGLILLINIQKDEKKEE
ncbi:hypothetical protein ACFLRQ_00210 [Bacteroidota bacterium]